MLGGLKTDFISVLEHTGADHISGYEPMDNPMKTIFLLLDLVAKKQLKNKVNTM